MLRYRRLSAPRNEPHVVATAWSSDGRICYQRVIHFGKIEFVYRGVAIHSTVDFGSGVHMKRRRRRLRV
jgi:hypothetical protein